MSVSVQALAAEMSLKVAETLIRVAKATPEDKLTWEPLENGRPILDQLIECCVANRKWAEILRSRAYANLPREIVEQEIAGLDTLDRILPKLRATAAGLAEAIRAIPDTHLAETIATEWGLYSLARCCLHAYWNMTYHEGQINYIQTLYGDFEEHE